MEEAYKQCTTHQATAKCQITQQQEQIHALQSEVRSHDEHSAALHQQNELLMSALRKISDEDNNASGILESPSKRRRLQQAKPSQTTTTPTAVTILQQLLPH